MAVEDTGLQQVHAFAHEFARLRPNLVRWFRRRVGEPSEAEDLAQECFVRIASRQERDVVLHVEGYVYQTARSVLFDRTRRRRARDSEAHVSLMPEHDSVEETNALRTLLAKEKLRRVSAILMTMPERTRSVFILSRLEGLRYAEIATRYAISVSAVQKHMLRAIETLMQAGEDDA
ncbi:RNA polymerase sigma factor [Novosphingobium sp. AP12]|uniref:RNA polymerase sigma factor n=1 Tax=Novosphingobium sp. AP12 TaxID=1144305 RepID=UPI0003097E64|nr:RNA polymerase sigma factor [Novosphingobium sp. AP12]